MSYDVTSNNEAERESDVEIWQPPKTPEDIQNDLARSLERRKNLMNAEQSQMTLSDLETKDPKKPDKKISKKVSSRKEKQISISTTKETKNNNLEKKSKEQYERLSFDSSSLEDSDYNDKKISKSLTVDSQREKENLLSKSQQEKK